MLLHRSSSAPSLHRGDEPLSSLSPGGSDASAHADGSQHGQRAHHAEQRARDVLASLPRGTLSHYLTPDFLHRVHHLSYAPNDSFSTWQGRLSIRYLAAWLRNKHEVQPGQLRAAPALAPEAQHLLRLNQAEVDRVRGAGGRFLGVPIGVRETEDGPQPHYLGKTVFRPAAHIPEQLAQLCEWVRDRLELLADDRDPLTGAWVAARFMLDFIAIHPYMDGNGRVSRCLAQAILKEFGLPAPDWEQIRVNLHSSPDAVASAFLRYPAPESEPVPNPAQRLNHRPGSAPEVRECRSDSPSTEDSASMHTAPSSLSSCVAEATPEPAATSAGPPAGPSAKSLRDRLRQPLPRQSAQAQREVLLRLRDLAQGWNQATPTDQQQLAQLLMSPQWVAQMARMNAEFNGLWRLPIARGEEEPLLSAQSAMKTLANVLYLELMTALAAQGLLAGDSVLLALTQVPAPNPHDWPSYLHTAASQAHMAGDERQAEALAGLLETVASLGPQGTAAHLRKTALMDSPNADVLGDKYADLLGRLVQDGNARHLPAGAARVVSQLLALDGVPSKEALQRKFGSTRARKYEKGLIAARHARHRQPSESPVGARAPVQAILDRLRDAIQPEVLARAARREFELAQADKDKQARWRITDDMLQAVADIARESWAQAMSEAKTRLQPGLLAWVTDPLQAGAYAGALGTLPTEPPDDFLTTVCAEVLQSQELQSIMAQRLSAASGTAAVVVAARSDESVRQRVHQHQKPLLEGARQRAEQAAARLAEDQALQRSRQAAQARASHASEEAATAAVTQRTERWVAQAVQQQVEQRADDSSRVASETATQWVRQAAQSAADSCLRDLEQTHARFEQMVAKQELQALEDRLELLKLERRLDELRRDSPVGPPAASPPTGSRIALDATGQPRVI